MFLNLTDYTREGLLGSSVPDHCDYREIKAHLRLHLAKMSLNINKKTLLFDVRIFIMVSFLLTAHHLRVTIFLLEPSNNL